MTSCAVSAGTYDPISHWKCRLALSALDPHIKTSVCLLNQGRVPACGFLTNTEQHVVSNKEFRQRVGRSYYTGPSLKPEIQPLELSKTLPNIITVQHVRDYATITSALRLT
jgi:hypothetical protein